MTKTRHKTRYEKRKDSGGWAATEKWSPSSAGADRSAVPVEHVDTGQLGYAKSKWIAHELIASRLGESVSAPVAKVVRGFSVPHDSYVAISIVQSEGDIDLEQWYRSWLHRNNRTLDSTDGWRERQSKELAQSELGEALGRASSLLAFYAWIGDDDLKRSNHIVRQSESKSEVLAIDFDCSAFAKAHAAVVPYTPYCPELTESLNRVRVLETVTEIENLSSDLIHEVFEEVLRVHPCFLLDNMADKLVERAKSVCNSVKDWLPLD